ncbi:hypothetical protein GWK08_01115 [Leptobacterium flavescens]|uniref:Lipoprotein n=1 Tax=Leptobacterium flavescens TaxID=472055 RepID=A0A6P0UJC4_9FLAO|nr:hypothetical protein [Leptobacterium flavescens]NER12028.1 hypothetical protein [Leptobacterium flavescens]
MKKQILVFGILISILGCQSSGKEKTEEQAKNLYKTERSVENNLLKSEELPKVNIRVDEEFDYIGNFDFEIVASSDEWAEEVLGKPIAAGERFVFAKADETKEVEKLFIVQFEGFLSNNTFTYKYDFSNAEFIGNNRYRHNTWFYDSALLAKENPQNEGARTRVFLEEKGFKLEDEYMMSRFVGLASEDRKNEIIIYYLEMLQKSTGYSLEEFENSIPEEEAESIETALIERSRESFTIEPY